MSQLADVTVGPHLKVPCVKVSPQTINRKVFESVEKSLSDSAVWGKERERQREKTKQERAGLHSHSSEICVLPVDEEAEGGQGCAQLGGLAAGRWQEGVVLQLLEG